MSAYLGYLQKNKSIEPTSIFLYSEYIRLLPKSWLAAFCTCSHVDGMITCLWCWNYILPMYVIVLILRERVPYSRYIFWGPWVARYFAERETPSARGEHCAWYTRGEAEQSAPAQQLHCQWWMSPGCAVTAQKGSGWSLPFSVPFIHP